MNVDKENRPPPSMAPVSKGTPGRRKTAGKENQYFDVGKVGRKTGITLEDTGVRDEYGMEPMVGIFSSPMKPSPEKRSDGTFTSSEMQMQESSAPDVNETLISRKTPRLPPPHALTPRHTNIGSPKRGSTGRPISRGQSVPYESEERTPSRSLTQPPANRVLDFMINGAENVRRSIESQSPFKPKRTLRRSLGPGSVRRDPFVLIPSPAKLAENINHEDISVTIEEGDEPAEHAADKTQERVNEQLPLDDGPLMLDNDDSYGGMQDQSDGKIEEAVAPDQRKVTSPSQRRARMSRKFMESEDETVFRPTAPVANTAQSRKRNRSSIEDEDISQEHSSVSQSQGDGTAPVAKRKRGRPSKDNVAVHRDNEEASIDPALLTYGDDYLAQGGEEDRLEAEEQSAPQKTSSSSKSTSEANIARERELYIAKRTGSSVPLNDSPARMQQPSSDRGDSRGVSMGPLSNRTFQASTPFEDAGELVSRYGRAVIKPLNYWEGEAYVWKNGEVEGVIRANTVEPAKKGAKRKTTAKRGKPTGKRLDTIEEKLEKLEEKLGGSDEISDTESVRADEWEEDVGVIAGNVAGWDPETQMGNSQDSVREDLAFAASSIVTRPVANSSFQYAKIMTLPFFGAGIVELPPGGFKHSKNSRKMQMVFFVHQGKVMVDVGGTGADQKRADTNKFAISKGGVWVVPRGNNYAITNESRTKTARIFFAQGCEIEAGL